MEFLLKLCFVLTYTDAPTEDGKFEPSLLLRMIGGWDDIEAVDDAHLLPREREPDEPCPALEKLRLAEAADPDDDDDEEITRLHRMLWDTREWHQEFAVRMMPRYDRFFELVGEMLEEREIRIEIPGPGASEPDDHMVILHFARPYELRTRMFREGGLWEEAVASLEDQNRLANFVIESPGPLVLFLIGMAMERTMLGSAEGLLNAPGIPPAQVARIRAILENGPNRNAEMARTWKHEYVFQKRMTHDLADGFTFDLGNWWAEMMGEKPSLHDKLRAAAWRSGQQALIAIGVQPNRTIRHFASLTEHAIAQTELPYTERIESKLPAALSAEAGWHEYIHPNGFARALTKNAAPPMMKALDRADHMEAHRQALLAVCGVRHYFEFRGRLPERLQDLVPDHLASVPRDPYDGGDVRYSADKGQVWVVGPDLKDDGGTYNERGPRFRAEMPAILLDDEAEGYDPTLQMQWMNAEAEQER